MYRWAHPALLSSGNYFTASGGTGTPLNSVDLITSNQTIYIYAETQTLPICTNERSFNITINSFTTVERPTARTL
ncbi:MAG: hypothetical protein QM485_10280 [Flavobacteriaceae bacterium]